jgi:hypothetical protein
MMTKLAGALCMIFAVTSPLWADQGTVRVEPTNLQGPRELKEETRSAVIRDYLEAWQSLAAAFEQNRPALLNRDFVGTAKEKLTDTIGDQVTTGISTRYLAPNHDLKIVFYSPEGLSVQLIDTVDYEVQILDHGKLQSTQRAHARYVVVMTPSEVRWRVRLFQGDPE